MIGNKITIKLKSERNHLETMNLLHSASRHIREEKEMNVLK
ncbi:hypothetical protein ABEY61_26420 [Bacillus toyonensis]